MEATTRAHTILNPASNRRTNRFTTNNTVVTLDTPKLSLRVLLVMAKLVIQSLPAPSNRPFPSCFEPLYQSEARCTTIHMKFFYERMSTRTRFEEEAKGNWEMAHRHPPATQAFVFFGRKSVPKLRHGTNPTSFPGSCQEKILGTRLVEKGARHTGYNQILLQ